MLVAPGVPGVNTVNVAAFEAAVPGEIAVTWFAPGAVRLAAGRKVAIPLVPIKMLAGSWLPFHCSVEQGDRLLPFTASATGDPVSASTAALAGESELSAGTGRVVPVGRAVRENLSELEFVAGPLETVMATAAAPVAR